MKILKVFNLFVISAIAFDPISLTWYTDENCAVPPPSPWIPTIILTDVAWSYGSSPVFQSFILNRSMLVNEQLDSNINITTECDTFQQSVWNWDTSCRSVNATTCFTFWINEGFSDGTFGEGWGWNSTSWVNITSNNN